MKRIASLVLLLVIAAAVIFVSWKLVAFMPPLSVQVLARGISKSIEDARLCGQVEQYIGAVLQRDELRALSTWVMPKTALQGLQLDQLASRRIAITHDLIIAHPSSTFEIKSIELWNPGCCESGPGVTGDYNWAAGARVQVDLAISGAWEAYVFDVFGDGQISEPANWLIRDIYRPSQAPLFWRLRSNIQYDAFP